MGVLPKSKYTHKYKGFMITGGPVPAETEETRSLILKIIEKYYGGQVDQRKVELAIEYGTMSEGDDPYHHFHCIVIAKDERIQWKKTCCEALKKICCEDGHRKVNCQANHTREQKKGDTTYSILHRYLTDPKKIKDCDGNITLGVKFAPTKEELYQAIHRHPHGSRGRELAIAEYTICMLDALRHNEKGVQLQ